MNSKKSTILFIDGNNLYHNLRQMKIKPSNLDFDKFVNLICSRFNLELKTVNYYNSMPTLKDGKDLYYSHLKFLNNLNKLPKFKVITRKLQVHSNKELIKEKRDLIESMDLCDSCRPIVEENILDVIGNVKKKEKGVDVKLAVDLIDSANENDANILILVSGDADFIPALESAQKKGAQILSSSVVKGYSKHLRDFCPFFAIGRNKLIENCLN